MTQNTATAPESKILARIRALLARTDEDSGCTPAERELAAQRAAEMMAKYAVDQVMLGTTRPADDPMERRVVRLEGSYQRPKGTLLNAVAIAMNVKSVRDQDVVYVFGRRSDLERFEFLFTHLLLQGVHGCASARPARRSYSSMTGGQVRSFRSAWFYGFAARIHERLTAGREEALREHRGTGAELVLMDRASAALAAAREMFPDLRQSRRVQVNAAGFDAGHAAGGSADLNQPRVGGGARALDA